MTGSDIEALIRSRIEPEEPQDSVLLFLEEYTGKRIDQRLIAKLNERIPGQDFRISYAGTGTHIAWGSRIDGNQYLRSLMVSYDTKNLRVEVDFIREYNPALLSGLKERNAARLASLEKKGEMERLAAAVHKLVEAQRTIDSLIKGSGPFETDRYAIDDLMEEELKKVY